MTLSASGVGSVLMVGFVLAPLVGPAIAWLTYLWAHKLRREGTEGAGQRIRSVLRAAAANFLFAVAVLLHGFGPAFAAGGVSAGAGTALFQAIFSSSPMVVWTSLLSLPVLHLQMRRAREEQGERCARNRGPSLVTVLLYELAVWLTAVAMACVRLVP